jgi:hypothetical protein
MVVTASWREWIDWDVPVGESQRLRDDAPQEEKDKFEEWKKQKEEERAQGIWK